MSEAGKVQHVRLHRRWVSTVLLFVMGGAWGLQFALLKVAAGDGLDEFGILTIALLSLFPIYGAVLVWKEQLYRPTWQHLWFFLVAGSLGYVIPLSAAAHASVHLPAGLVALIASLTPVVTVVVALLLRTERVSSLRIVAVVFGVLAALVVLGADLELPGLGASTWVLVAFLAPLAYGLDGIYVAERWPEDLNAMQVVAGEALVSGLVLLGLFVLNGSWVALLAFGPSAWGNGHSAVVIFILVSVIEVYLFFYLIRVAGAVLVSFGSFVALVAGIFWGWLIFSEQLGIAVWIAAGLLSAALFCVTLGTNDEKGVS